MEKSRLKYKLLIAVSTMLMTIYFIWRLCFTLPLEKGIVPLIAAIIMFCCELISAIEAFVHLVTTMNQMNPEKPDIPKEWYPEVDVFIATHNESTDILYKTINGCKHMKYPDKSKVHIWICDDGYRMEVKELAEKMGVGWQGLENNTLAKAGNLNNALHNTSAPLVVTFDADMIPTRDFLMETVPFFFLPKMKKTDNGEWVERTQEEIDPDYKIGFIQTPQSFYNPDLFQYNLYAEDKVPNEQDYFFREINVSRNKSNSPIYAGSNTVILRQALEEVGGIATGTITEDFETGIHIQGKGYTCYAINKVVAHGLAPDSVDSLIKQRERWGRGCIYSLRKMHIWTNKELSFKSKISYYTCKMYWWTFLRRFVFILCPIIFSVFSIPVMECEPWELVVFWLPSYMLFNYAQKVESGEIRTVRWSNIIDTVLFPYLIIPIFLEAVGFKKNKFVVTRKDRVIEETNDTVLAIPHMILLAFSVFALVMSFSDLIRYGAIGGIVIIYWLFVNAFALLMAIFFMVGRKNFRMNERYQAEIPVKLETSGKVYYGDTQNISENGAAIIFKEPIYFTENSIQVELKTQHYLTQFVVRPVYVSTEEDKNTGEKVWKYSFKIVEIDDENKSQYFQMIYDRHPSLPTKTSKHDSIFANVSDNLTGRINGTAQQKRALYRVQVNKDIPQSDNKHYVYMYDYSYRYVVLRKRDVKEKQFIKLMPISDVIMECEYERALSDSKLLYRIVNGEELLFDKRFEATLKSWVDNDHSL